MDRKTCGRWLPSFAQPDSCWSEARLADLTLAAHCGSHWCISQGQQWKDRALDCMSSLSPSCGPAGSYGRQLLDGSGESLKLQPWQIALGLAFTVGALGYIGRIAKDVRSAKPLDTQAISVCMP